MEVSILYEDSDCLVINKPAGVDVNELPYEFPVHRLDKGTTGCLLIAKNGEAHAFLQKQFKNRTIKKMYLALVAGVPGQKEAIIDAPIGRSLRARVKMSITGVKKEREAQTRYVILSSSKGDMPISLLECKPTTGRTHQIRVHLASIGHPILGDETYGSKASRGASKKIGIRGLCLHAWKLVFESPMGIKVQAEAPIPHVISRSTDKTQCIPICQEVRRGDSG